MVQVTARREFFLPRGQAEVYDVSQGEVFRLEQVAPGGQVVDLTVYRQANPAERLWGAKTAWEHGTHLTTGAPLLSTGPGETALMQVVADTLPTTPSPAGTRFHDVILSCCSRKSHGRRYGSDWGLPGCFDSLAEAIAKKGLPPDYVQDTFNVFMRTGFGADDKPFHEVSDARPGDALELLALVDVWVAISNCQGRSSRPDSAGVRVAVSSR